MVRESISLPEGIAFGALQSYAYCLEDMFDTLLRTHPSFIHRINEQGVIEVQYPSQALIPNDIQETANVIAAEWAKLMLATNQPLPYFYHQKIQGFIFDVLTQAWRKLVKVTFPIPRFPASEV